MRRLHPLILPVLALVACTQPPVPEKAKDLDKIQPKDDDDKGHAQPALGPIPTGVIAKVGDVEIPNEAFTSIYELKVKKYTDRGRDIPRSADRRYRKSIAERLIYHEVLRQETAKLGIEYDPEKLNERKEQQRRGIRDWEKHLARRGETEESLEAMYIAELREKAILNKLNMLEVTDAEVEEDYEKIKGNWHSKHPRVRASHILVPIGPRLHPHGRGKHEDAKVTDEQKAKWEAEAKAKADAIYEQVMADNADFEAIAKETSTGPSAAKGGDIGIFTADRMAEEFSEAAFAMDVGEISKPIKTKFGYHIIKLTGKWPPGELPQDALEDQIIKRLTQRKLHKGKRELKKQLLDKYEIVDNIKPTLGPEPRRHRPPARRMGARHGKGPHKGAHGKGHGPHKGRDQHDGPRDDDKGEAVAQAEAAESSKTKGKTKGEAVAQAEAAESSKTKDKTEGEAKPSQPEPAKPAAAQPAAAKSAKGEPPADKDG